MVKVNYQLPRQKACDRMPSQMVYPTFFPQLRHYRIDPWKSRLSLLQFPQSNKMSINNIFSRFEFQSRGNYFKYLVNICDIFLKYFPPRFQ